MISVVLTLTCLAAPAWDASTLNEELNGQGWRQDHGASVRTEDGVISIWRDRRGDEFNIRLRLIPADGTPAAPSSTLTGLDGYSYRPTVVTGPAGEILVCWNDGDTHGIWLDSDGTASSAIFEFDSNAEGPSSESDILINHDGNVVFAWRHDELYTAVYSPSGSLLHGPTLFGPDEFWIGGPFIALQADNSILAAFPFHDDTYLTLPNVQLLDENGAPSSTHQLASGEETIDTPEVQVFPSDDGTNLLYWIAENDNPSSQYYVRTTDAYGNFLSDPIIVDASQFAPRAGGGWNQYWLTEDQDIMFQVISPDGLPQANSSRMLYSESADNPGESATISEISLSQSTTGTSGELVLTWNQEGESSSDLDVYCRAIDADGDKYGPVQQASDDTTTADQDKAAIAALPGGGFVAAWREKVLTTSNSQFVIYLRGFDADGQPTTDEIRVQDVLDQEAYATDPVVRANESGIAVAWSDDRESFGNAYLQRFDMQLQPVGDNVRVTTWDYDPHNSGTNADTLDLALGADGTACCGFDRGGEDNRLSYVRMIDSNGDLADARLVSTSYYSGYDNHRTHVVALPSGLFGVAYVHSTPSNYELEYRTYGNGGSQQGSALVIAELSEDPLHFEFTVNDSGYGVMAYSHEDDASLHVIEMTPSGDFQDVMQIDTGSDHAPSCLAADLSESNEILLAWSERPYGGSDAVGQVRWTAGDPDAHQLSYLDAIDDGDLGSTIDAAWLGDTAVICASSDHGTEAGSDVLGFVETIPCPADVDGSGSVDVEDVLAVIGAWGSSSPGNDVDGDGIVDIDDLLLVLSSFNCTG
ncbi:MAG: hypothetical protein MK116_07160 [Phycisphaerales bacterium]|nr:hypothetical protein [Phycisphaerales bacterium]